MYAHELVRLCADVQLVPLSSRDEDESSFVRVVAQAFLCRFRPLRCASRLGVGGRLVLELEVVGPVLVVHRGEDADDVPVP